MARKPEVITGFGTALSRHGAVTLLVKDTSGREHKFLAMPSSVPQIVDMMISIQKEAGTLVSAEPVQKRSIARLSTEELETAKRLLKAENCLSGSFAVLAAPQFDMVQLLYDDGDGSETALAFGHDSVEALVGHLTRALEILEAEKRGTSTAIQ